MVVQLEIPSLGSKVFQNRVPEPEYRRACDGTWVCFGDRWMD